LATRERARAAGRGRPAWLYAAAEGLSEPDPRVRDYAGLASALASHIARTSADPSTDALTAGIEWGRSLAIAAPGPRPTSASAARRKVVGILAELGFDPAADARATTVALRRCPLLDTARRYPEVVCSVHLGIVRGAMSVFGGEPDRTALLPFAEPDACRLHLRTGADG
jgi:predicted ArsR family transcriptional regulator